MFDLAQLDSRAFAEKGIHVDILHRETGEKTGIKIHVQGADSMAYKNSSFFRVCTPENEAEREVKIQVIQGGNIPEDKQQPPIKIETTVIKVG